MATNNVVGSFFGDYNTLFAVIGAASVCFLTFKILSSLLRGLKAYFFGHALGLSANLVKFGKWAVVTGATDGIGKAYAEQLAEMGLNVVLVSRTLARLEETATEIERRYKVQTRVIAADLSKGQEIYNEIETQLDGLEIGVLVNNVGMTYSYPQYFLELENLKQTIIDHLNCNCLSMTMMTQICLPQMEARRKGVVINISSASGLSPSPLLTLYSATKAYIDFFSRGLQYEYQDKGIIVQVVAPGFVATKLSKIKKSSWMIPTPTNYVHSALRTVGVETRTMGYVSHALQVYVAGCIPQPLLVKCTMKLLNGFRVNALKKIIKKQQQSKTD